MIYVGTVYSHPDAKVRQLRYLIAVQAAAVMASYQLPCYVPIAAWHDVADRYALPGDHLFWKEQDGEMLMLCAEGWFVRTEGFDESAGCQQEMKTLKLMRKPVRIFEGVAGLQDYASARSRLL